MGNNSEARGKIGGVWKAVGGIVGLATIIALVVAVMQLWQSQTASVTQDFGQATQIILLQEQLSVQREMATLQASASGSGPASTLVADRLDELQGTAVAFSTQEAQFNEAGNIVVDEDFQDGVANGFTSGGEGGSWNWDVVNDGAGNRVFEAKNSTNAWSYSPFGPKDFSDGTVQFRVRLLDFDLSSDSGSGIVMINFRLTSQGGGYAFVIHPYQQKAQLVYFDPDSQWVSLDGGASLYKFEPNEWYTVRIEAKGENLQAFLNDASVGLASDTRYAKGEVSIGAGPNTTVQFDDIKLWTSR